MNDKAPHRRSYAGTSTLEFIVILPFLLIIMMIAVELSRALATYNVVVQASREGARKAVITSPLALSSAADCGGSLPNAAIVSACGLIASVPSLSLAGTTVTLNCASTHASCYIDDPVTVNVNTRFVSIFADFFAFASTIGSWWNVPVPALLSPAGIPLAHQTVMRYE